DDVSERMRDMGFEPGWGKTAKRMRDTLSLLSEILEAPEPSVLEQFLARIPMIFSVVILSPHGYFGQSDVLGLPDTGGQVVYILDQARALEQELHKRLDEQGIDIDPQILIVTRLIPQAVGTTCDQRIERVEGTQHARILRVPFRDRSGAVVPNWISRFEIWPYLERFAIDAEKETLAELGGCPALIIGNYSDGNLVASIMSGRLQVTQCNIAHALEKSKYLYSDLYWRENEETYHFACQFTADLISMNTADFIITSTYQEIRGTEDSIGQYENYGAFTMPDLYRVVNGIDVFDPKFNVVSPGAAPEICFPYTEEDRRLTALHDRLESLVLGDGGGTPCRGGFADASKPSIFTMARLDRVKNIAGLVEWYGRSPRLRAAANLLVVGGHIDVERSTDHEEREQIDTLHRLFDEYDLEGQVRWVEFQSDRSLVGELYRRVADGRGVFVKPALFEAYGLTVIEAMSSGLPVFATCYGGPSEVIEHGVSGFHIDPQRGDAAAAEIADFFERCAAEPEYWLEISQGALERVRLRYTWELYAQRMMTLARVYGFWKYVTDLEREETRRYLEMLYALQYRPLAESLPD
ncbi:MAG: sucrose synthase, partial [Deltaproteobacteria bacterium]|nr:sucrose synthase [Deltaproteobacteria bacterium]